MNQTLEVAGMSGRAHLVCLVVILGVVFKHLLLLGIFESANEIIGSELLSPFLVVDEPSV